MRHKDTFQLFQSLVNGLYANLLQLRSMRFSEVEVHFPKRINLKWSIEKSDLQNGYNLFTRRRATKAFYRSPKTTFLAYFHVLAGNHQLAYY